MKARLTCLVVSTACFILVLGLMLFSGQISLAQDVKVEFTDVKKQTQEFIRYFNSIQLTPEQETIRRDALSTLPAPCCSDKTAATCCCTCNMSRSIWGLSKYLIVEKNATIDDVRVAASDWIEFINPSGFKGDTCYTGGCGRSFSQGGCGGMNGNNIVWGP